MGDSATVDRLVCEAATRGSHFERHLTSALVFAFASLQATNRVVSPTSYGECIGGFNAPVSDHECPLRRVRRIRGQVEAVERCRGRSGLRVGDAPDGEHARYNVGLDG